MRPSSWTGKPHWILLATVLLACGCAQTRPTTPTAQPPLPAYVYPPEPPLVEATDLQGVLVRLDAPRTLLWVFDRADPASARLARLLAEQRDGLRRTSVALFGLFTGPPGGWQAATVPMLRSAGANFPCAVLAPDQKDELTAWLSGGRGEPLSAGVFLLGRTGRLLTTTGSDEASLRALLEGLRGSTSAQPVTTEAALPDAAGLRCEIRVVDLATQRTIVHIEADGSDTASLVRALAARLATSSPPQGRTAILPFRWTARPGDDRPDEGAAVANLLSRALARSGWPDLLPAEQVHTTLEQAGLTVYGAEFDLERTRTDTGWAAIILGAVWETSRVPDPTDDLPDEPPPQDRARSLP